MFKFKEFLSRIKNPRYKQVDISQIPILIDCKSVRLKCTLVSGSTVGKVVPQSSNYSLELLDKNNEWQIWPLVQSFSFNIDISKNSIPEIKVGFIDFIKKVDR